MSSACERAAALGREYDMPEEEIQKVLKKVRSREREGRLCYTARAWPELNLKAWTIPLSTEQRNILCQQEESGTL